MDKYKELKRLLGDKKGADVFINYCRTSEIEIDKKSGKPKNYFWQKINANKLAYLFNKVAEDGLVFDGKHVTLQSTGVSYDYVAYKNKMLIAYPESLIDLQLVYDGDSFSFKKESGKVTYKHEFSDPFGQTDDKIIGGYCVVKNMRGEFITILTKEDLVKHKSVAKTKYIWNAWFKEMCLKTIMKKAVKVHFDDVFEDMNEEDNKQNDLSLVEKKDWGVLIANCEDRESMMALWGCMTEDEQVKYEDIVGSKIKSLTDAV